MQCIKKERNRAKNWNWLTTFVPILGGSPVTDVCRTWYGKNQSPRKALRRKCRTKGESHIMQMRLILRSLAHRITITANNNSAAVQKEHAKTDNWLIMQISPTRPGLGQTARRADDRIPIFIVAPKMQSNNNDQ